MSPPPVELEAPPEELARLVADLLARCDPRRLARGLAGHRQGAVTEVWVGPGWLSGRVRGKAGESSPELWQAGATLRFECGCRDRVRPCAHAPALLAAAVARLRDDEAARRAFRGEGEPTGVGEPVAGGDPFATGAASSASEWQEFWEEPPGPADSAELANPPVLADSAELANPPVLGDSAELANPRGEPGGEGDPAAPELPEDVRLHLSRAPIRPGGQDLAGLLEEAYLRIRTAPGAKRPGPSAPPWRHP